MITKLTASMARKISVPTTSAVCIYQWRLQPDDQYFMSKLDDLHDVRVPEPVHSWVGAVGQMAELATGVDVWILAVGVFSLPELLKGLNGYDCSGQLVTAWMCDLVSVWPSGAIEWHDDTVTKRDKSALTRGYMELVERSAAELR